MSFPGLYDHSYYELLPPFAPAPVGYTRMEDDLPPRYTSDRDSVSSTLNEAVSNSHWGTVDWDTASDWETVNSTTSDDAGRLLNPRRPPPAATRRETDAGKTDEIPRSPRAYHTGDNNMAEQQVAAAPKNKRSGGLLFFKLCFSFFLLTGIAFGLGMIAMSYVQKFRDRKSNGS